MNNLSPFITAIEALLSNTSVSLLAVIGIWQAFLNNDPFIASLTDRQFDWFMLFGSTLLEGAKIP